MCKQVSVFVKDEFVWVKKDAQDLVHGAEAIGKYGCGFGERGELGKGYG